MKPSGRTMTREEETAWLREYSTRIKDAAQVYPRSGACHCGAGYGFPRVFQDKKWGTWDLYWKCMNGHTFSETVRI